MSKRGGAPTTLYEIQSSAELGDVVGTSTGVYVLDLGVGAGRVRRVPLDGGPPELIAEAKWPEVGRNLAVDGLDVHRDPPPSRD